MMILGEGVMTTSRHKMAGLEVGVVPDPNSTRGHDVQCMIT